MYQALRHHLRAGRRARQARRAGRHKGRCGTARGGQAHRDFAHLKFAFDRNARGRGGGESRALGGAVLCGAAYSAFSEICAREQHSGNAQGAKGKQPMAYRRDDRVAAGEEGEGVSRAVS